MQTLDEKPETIHLYVVREKEPKPSILPTVLSALSLIVLLSFCVLTPYQQPEVRAVIRVPAVPLFIKTFSTSIKVIPTGIKEYPATTARGVLTITNGSIIGQSMPAGFTIQGVQTDNAVYVPSGSANGYGWAQVSAHALIAGKGGDFATFKINAVIGSSVYIRNLTAFSGGRDAYSVKVITSNDRNVALSKARTILTSKISGLHYPCQEIVNNRISIVNLIVTWRCQFVTYHLPFHMHVTRVRIQGKNLLIDVVFIQPLRRTWAK